MGLHGWTIWPSSGCVFCLLQRRLDGGAAEVSRIVKRAFGASAWPCGVSCPALIELNVTFISLSTRNVYFVYRRQIAGTKKPALGGLRFGVRRGRAALKRGQRRGREVVSSVQSRKGRAGRNEKPRRSGACLSDIRGTLRPREYLAGWLKLKAPRCWASGYELARRFRSFISCSQLRRWNSASSAVMRS